MSAPMPPLPRRRNRPALAAWIGALAISATHVALAAAPSPADLRGWEGVWEGRLGSQKVVVALTVDSEHQALEGRYFYQRFGRDLSLWGPKAGAPMGDTLQLSECPPDVVSFNEPCTEPSGTWSLQRPEPSAQGSAPRLTGQWTPVGQAGRRAPTGSPIELRRVGDYQASGGAMKDPYEARREQGIRGTTRPGGRLGPVAWQTLVDARSRVSTPQFTRGAAPEVLTRINQQLERQWRERATEALAAVDHDDELAVAFANPRWLALTYSVGFYYAGAAHPSNGFAAQTFDLATGQPVDWRQWFRFTPTGRDTLDVNRKDNLASLVIKAHMARAAQAGGAEGTASEECAQMVVDHYECRGGRCAHPGVTQGQTPSGWALWPTPAGLAVAVDIYPEVARGCRGEAITLPWAQARGALLRPRELP